MLSIINLVVQWARAAESHMAIEPSLKPNFGLSIVQEKILGHIHMMCKRTQKLHYVRILLIGPLFIFMMLCGYHWKPLVRISWDSNKEPLNKKSDAVPSQFEDDDLTCYDPHKGIIIRVTWITYNISHIGEWGRWSLRFNYDPYIVWLSSVLIESF